MSHRTVAAAFAASLLGVAAVVPATAQVRSLVDTNRIVRDANADRDDDDSPRTESDGSVVPATIEGGSSDDDATTDPALDEAVATTDPAADEAVATDPAAAGPVTADPTLDGTTPTTDPALGDTVPTTDPALGDTVATGPAIASGEAATQRYAFVNSKDLAAASRDGSSVVIVKGRSKASDVQAVRQALPGTRIVNYEQSFALNSTEASYARARGYLAKTCGGAEIHPANIPGVTLLDAANPAAVAWRSSAIAAETTGAGMDGTYLDTLRSFFNPDFYDGTPCGVSNEAWLKGSIAMVDQVKAKSGGKFVIANGNGMQSGRNYFKYQAAADQLIARADAVQIEHFGRARDMTQDVAFVQRLQSQSKWVFAKCDGSPATCETALSQVGGSDKYLALR